MAWNLSFEEDDAVLPVGYESFVNWCEDDRRKLFRSLTANDH